MGVGNARCASAICGSYNKISLTLSHGEMAPSVYVSRATCISKIGHRYTGSRTDTKDGHIDTETDDRRHRDKAGQADQQADKTMVADTRTHSHVHTR
eukprot:16684-Eustigmatos_ZCMA.PRE.1